MNYYEPPAPKLTPALMKELEIVATHSNLYSAATGHIFVAQTPEQFQYDANSNLLAGMTASRGRYPFNH